MLNLLSKFLGVSCLVLFLGPTLQGQQRVLPPRLAAAVPNQPADGKTNQLEAAAAGQPPRVIEVSEIASAAQNALALIRKIESDLAIDPKVVNAVRNRLDSWEVMVSQNAQETRAAIRRTGSLTNLEEHKDNWLNELDALEAAMGAFVKHMQMLGLDLTKVEESRALWRRSIERLKQDAPGEVFSQVNRIVDQLDGLAQDLVRRRNQAVIVQSRLSDIEVAVDAVIKDIEAAHVYLESRLFKADAPPLWTALAEEQTGLGLAAITHEWHSRMESLRTYFQSNPIRFVIQGSFMAASVLLVFLLRRSATSFTEETRKAQAVALLLQRPITVGLITALVMNPIIHPRSVLGFRMVWAPILVFLVVRLLWVLVEPPARRGLVISAVFYLADYIRVLLWNVPAWERLVLLVEAMLAIGYLRILPVTIVTNARGRRAWAVFRKVLIILLSVGAFCTLIGFSGLGRFLTYGTIRSPLIACGHLAVFYVVSSTLAVALLTPTARRLHMVTRHPELVSHYLDRILAILVGILCLERLLTTYSVRDHVWQRLSQLLSTPLNVGSLSVSLGDVMLFGFVLWLSFKFSQFIRFVFEVDVFSRMSLPRGVPYAASSAMHYAILLLGFFAAIMAAGVDISRLTLLGGAVGLGVGFGLQNIVNNFVSGLILLFERPIQVGDRIEVDTVSGQVQRIGIRSSTVRTFDGAEVIVPNSDLIAKKLTNWTLSDQRRRFAVAIGVKYGTDPQRVIDLLLRIAREHGDVLQQPRPEAAFLTHGENSLDFELRVWTDRGGDWGRIQSELTVALNRLLTAEGIEIPYPQRDLHLRTSDISWPAALPSASSSVPPATLASDAAGSTPEPPKPPPFITIQKP